MPALVHKVALVMPGRGRRNRLTIDRHDPLAGAGRDIAGHAGWTDGT